VTTTRGKKGVTKPDNAFDFRLAYSTKLGRAYQGDSRDLLRSEAIPAGSVDLIVTSPPFALTRKKAYGNEQEQAYIDWFTTFVKPFKRVLAEHGSLVIDLGGAYLPGKPKRSTYHWQLAIALAKEFDLCQEFYWYNPAKLPSPAEWVNVRRLRVKDSLNLVLWFANDAGNTLADNRRVLKRYSDSMKALLKNGYQYRTRPSGHDLTDKFLKDHQGAIPPNLLGFEHYTQEFEELSGEPWGDLDGDVFGSLFPNLLTIANTSSNDEYQRRCREHQFRPHPARFPVGLPAFFIEFLTDGPDRVVLDPFAGSNVTGAAAEALGRRWISCDLDREGEKEHTYVRASALRFEDPVLEPGFDYALAGDYRPTSFHAKQEPKTPRRPKPA
jgi:site-specific DNA-methyltransferase (cytosine-N4-specific)